MSSADRPVMSDDLQVEPISDHLAGRQIALCVAGGIAAIESPRVARALRRHGAVVRSLMTEAATRFITPLSLEWGTGRPVTTALSGAVEHIATDHAIVVAPATLDIIARLAHGLADDPVTTRLASAIGRVPVLLAPAMHTSLARSPIHRRNLELLGPLVTLIPSRLAEGKEKVAPPEEIARATVRALARGPLVGAPVLVTAGPTRANVDRFRFLGNRSTGRLGCAIAEELHLAGADVTLVYGPAEAEPPSGVTLVRVETYDQMREATLAGAARARAGVFAAAVLDFAPAQVIDQKLPSDRAHSVELQPTAKIIHAVDEVAPEMVKIGFKLEYQPGGTSEEHLRQAGARAVVQNRLDAVVVNAIDAVGAAADDHPALLIGVEGDEKRVHGKAAIARAIVKRLATRLTGRKGHEG
jgi:phosphopantothenoylcysteine decarboxylase/phosphopantothenate--cysteine ligase